MKKHILFFLGLTTMLCACTRQPDSLIGTWTVDKVNVQFDERRSTPELVKQMGEMERQNRLTITSDSILILKSLDGETQGRLSLGETGTLLCNGEPFGQWTEGKIVTRTPSPLGEIIIKYRKE
jgi:hypothetical protein